VTVLVAWTMGIEMDLNFNLLETACFALSILVTSLVLQLPFHSLHYLLNLEVVLVLLIYMLLYD